MLVGWIAGRMAGWFEFPSGGLALPELSSRKVLQVHQRAFVHRMLH